MNIKTQRELAAKIFKVGSDRVWFDNTRLEDIKKAITKNDIRSLIAEDVIKKKQKTGISGFRIRKNLVQKRKGRRKGTGSKEGKRTSRAPRKRDWINRVRPQRSLLDRLKEGKLITIKDYGNLRKKIKGGFFRSTRHIKLYVGEKGLIKKDGKK